MFKPIGVTGFARSGKDTFYSIFKKYAEEEGYKTQRVALADNLKDDLKDFIQKYFKIDIYNVENKEKEFVRPLMVIYGKLKRESTQGKYWTNKVQAQVDELVKNDIIPVITDIRYMEYEEDEYFWLKQKNNGLLVSINQKSIKPANIEEKTNISKIKKLADFKINWKKEPDRNILFIKYKNKLKKILKYATNS